MQRGRPRKSPEQKKGSNLELRIGASEKQAFQNAAMLAGVPLSTWVRERLRRAATRELEEAGRPIPFLQNLRLG
jgi:hypothetical protein